MLPNISSIDFSALSFNFEMPSREEMAIGAKERFDRVAHFMIDRWPESVRALSFPTTMVPVSAAEMRGLYETEDRDAWKANATQLADRLDAIMQWDAFFIRMSSRSPKDVTDRPITCSGRQAVDWIASSMRCMEDVSTADLAEEQMFICLRQPLHMFADGEFRCFARDGKVLGVSRYFYNTEPEHRMPEGKVLAAATAFYDKHLAAHYPDVVFDLYLPGMEGETLIELNPYGLSDPCLFGSYDEVEQGGERLGGPEAA